MASLRDKRGRFVSKGGSRFSDTPTPDGVRLAQLLEQIKRGPSVKIGVLDDGKGSEDRQGVTNAELAAIHELGAGVPKRGWISSTFDRVRGAVETNAKILVGHVLDGKLDLEKALGILGAKFASDVKETVVGGEQIPPPNAPSTLARKLSKTREGSTGEPRTLVDTGRMLGAVSWLVEMIRGGKS